MQSSQADINQPDDVDVDDVDFVSSYINLCVNKEEPYLSLIINWITKELVS